MAMRMPDCTPRSSAHNAHAHSTMRWFPAEGSEALTCVAGQANTAEALTVYTYTAHLGGLDRPTPARPQPYHRARAHPHALGHACTWLLMAAARGVATSRGARIVALSVCGRLPLTTLGASRSRSQQAPRAGTASRGEAEHRGWDSKALRGCSGQANPSGRRPGAAPRPATTATAVAGAGVGRGIRGRSRRLGVVASQSPPPKLRQRQLQTAAVVGL